MMAWIARRREEVHGWEGEETTTAGRNLGWGGGRGGGLESQPRDIRGQGRVSILVVVEVEA